MPLTTIKSSNIKDAEVKNVDISPTAAIDTSKVTGCLLYTSDAADE